MPRYKLVKDGPAAGEHITADGQPEDGFPTATDAVLWGSHLSGEWYIIPVEDRDE
jgi:hypothetical protein